MDPGLDESVRQIVVARKTLTVLEDLSGARMPATLADAYRMQNASVERWDDEVVGWKVGATAKQVQERFGISMPIYGPIFKRTVVQSPAVLLAQGFHHLIVESEFAFRFGENLPARSTPYARSEIVAAVDALAPAFEIVSPRFKMTFPAKILQSVADFGNNGGAVLGPFCDHWRELDLPSHAVKLFAGGTLRQEGKGAATLGDPVTVLEWFVNTFRAQGSSIARGAFVLTGTMTGLHTAEIGQLVAADFGNLGRVEITFV